MIVCLDANIVIYFVEQNADWYPKVMTRLKALAPGDQVAVSEAARLECLVRPLEMGDLVTLSYYRSFFASAQIRLLPVTASIWEEAARIRAIDRVSALDAIHLASAAAHGCGLFLTSDAKLARCTAIPVEVLT